MPVDIRLLEEVVRAVYLFIHDSARIPVKQTLPPNYVTTLRTHLKLTGLYFKMQINQQRHVTRESSAAGRMDHWHPTVYGWLLEKGYHPDSDSGVDSLMYMVIS